MINTLLCMEMKRMSNFIAYMFMLMFGVKVQKPIRRIKRTRSIKYHFLAKGLAKKSNPYARKRKSKLFKLRSKKRRRTVKRKVKLFKLR